MCNITVAHFFSLQMIKNDEGGISQVSSGSTSDALFPGSLSSPGIHADKHPPLATARQETHHASSEANFKLHAGAKSYVEFHDNSDFGVESKFGENNFFGASNSNGQRHLDGNFHDNSNFENKFEDKHYNDIITKVTHFDDRIYSTKVHDNSYRYVRNVDDIDSHITFYDNRNPNVEKATNGIYRSGYSNGLKFRNHDGNIFVRRSHGIHRRLHGRRRLRLHRSLLNKKLKFLKTGISGDNEPNRNSKTSRHNFLESNNAYPSEKTGYDNVVVPSGHDRTSSYTINTLKIDRLSRNMHNQKIRCVAYNNNITARLSTSVTITLNREFLKIIIL